MGNAYYKRYSTDGMIHYVPKTDYEVPVWSPGRIRHFLKDVVNDAERDSVRQYKRHSRLSKLVSETYADIHVPLRKAYNIDVKTGDERQILVNTLYNLKNDAVERRKTSNGFAAFSAVVAPPITTGALFGYAMYLTIEHSMSTVEPSLPPSFAAASFGIMACIAVFAGELTFSEEINKYLSKREKVANDRINERFDRVNVAVVPQNVLPFRPQRGFWNKSFWHALLNNK